MKIVFTCVAISMLLSGCSRYQIDVTTIGNIIEIIFKIIAAIVGVFFVFLSILNLKDRSTCWTCLFMAVLIITMCFLIVFVFPVKHYRNTYIEVERVDNNKYIQCINNTKMLIISANSSRASDTSTMLLGSDGKPIPCSVVKYTESEIDLPQNKDKKFVSIAE